MKCTYSPTTTEAEHLIRHGMIDWHLNAQMRRAFGVGIGPTPVVLLGQQTWTNGSGSTASRTHAK